VASGFSRKFSEEARMFIRRRSSVIVLVSLLAGAIVPACAQHSSTTTSRAGSFDDATVTTRVKTAFINDTVVGAARIDVETAKGVVTLAGRVATREQEARAIELARAIKGVVDVKSTLLIQP
jgi:hyperosmotically inducible protein